MSDSDQHGAAQHYLGDKGKQYFAWQGGGGGFAARIIVRRFQHLVRPDAVVLDFGCGGGYLLEALTAARKIGVEINPAAREHARSLGIECHAELSAVPDGSADVVLSHHALEHVEFPIGVLRELRGKLKPGGLLCLCVPIDNWRLQRRYDKDDLNHHLHTWTAQLLGNTLDAAGYDIERIDYRVESWPKGWTVFLYGRLPYALFKACCYVHGLVTGKGRELQATARPRGSAAAP